MAALRKLLTILRIRFYRRLAAGMAAVYLILYMVALQDISLGGRALRFLTTDWTRMVDRTGVLTFEPIAQLTLPGVTILVSPVNLAIGSILSWLVGLNLVVTYIAFRQPGACRINRATGIAASLPALLAGSACCAPAIVLVLGLEVSAALITVFQVLIPVSLFLLLLALALVLSQTETDLIA